MTAVSPRCSGLPSTGTSSPTVSLMRSSSRSISSAGTSASAAGTSSCVQSATSGVGSTATVAENLNGPSSSGRPSNSTSGLATGRIPESSAALQNHESRWLFSASCHTASRPTRATTTGTGAFPCRKPGRRSDAAMSLAACSKACWRSAWGTSTSRRTRLSGSSSTVAFTRGHCVRRASRVGRAYLHVVEVDHQPVGIVQGVNLPAGRPAETEDPGHRRLEVPALHRLCERAEPGSDAPRAVVGRVAVEVVAAGALEDDPYERITLDVDRDVARILAEGRLRLADLEARDTGLAAWIRVRSCELEDDPVVAVGRAHADMGEVREDVLVAGDLRIALHGSGRLLRLRGRGGLFGAGRALRRSRVGGDGLGGRRDGRNGAGLLGAVRAAARDKEREHESCGEGKQLGHEPDCRRPA